MELVWQYSFCLPPTTNRASYRCNAYDFGSNYSAGALQVAGGMDYLVHLAEKALRKIQSVLLFAPIVTYLFTLCAGTGHVAYSVLPVIAEVSRESGIRPERPMSIAVIASQQAITASPISGHSCSFSNVS